MRHSKTGTRFAAAALCAVIGISTGFYPAMNSWAADYEKVNGNYQMANGTVVKEVIARGIDVSRWQGSIDWASAAANDVSFVMIGTRSKGTVDPYFQANVKGASEAGLKVGAYIYSLAATEDMAREEADFVLNLVKDYPISFPIAFDAEDSATLGTLPPAEVSKVINAFCQRIEDAGYYPIVYANDNWLANKIDLSTMHHDIWVARYGAKHKYSDPIMWQVSSSGSIAGINGNVDIDFLYKDLTPRLPENLWRTIAGQKYYYQNYVMQRLSWINDGTGWFYMNEGGQPSTGWIDKSGLKYYLDETSGRMITGWKSLSGNWYYFNASGAMNTGWLLDGGVRYYLEDDGIMATGWKELNGQYYYLSPSGGMSTGWKELNGKWYFLSENGVMATGWLDNNGIRYYLNNDGSMVTGWHTEGASKYYLGESGGASVGWKLLNNDWYFFNQNGVMTTGWVNPDGNWYYLMEDGKMQSGWLEEKGAKYYLSASSGKMTVGWRLVDENWYYFGSSGAMETGMVLVDGKQYYLNPADGKMAVGWRQLDGSWYYFGDSGAMAAGMVLVDGKQYYLNPADGKMIASAAFDVGGVAYTADASGAVTAVTTAAAAGTAAETETAAETTAGAASETEAAPSGTPANPAGSSETTAETTAPAETKKEIGPGIH